MSPTPVHVVFDLNFLICKNIQQVIGIDYGHSIHGREAALISLAWDVRSPKCNNHCRRKGGNPFIHIGIVMLNFDRQLDNV